MGKIPAKNKYDAIIVGSGPNGLAASITIAQAGRSVLLIEQKETIWRHVLSSLAEYLGVEENVEMKKYCPATDL